MLWTRISSLLMAACLAVSMMPSAAASLREGDPDRSAYREDRTIYTVTFDPGGSATVSPTSMKVMNGSLYGELPTPERNGYNFDGWFTSEIGGTWITKSSEVDLTKDQTLYAHWTAAPLSWTVSFDPNGGSVDPISKSVVTGAIYGDLPTPVHSYLTFEGWYTSRAGGQLVTRTSIVKESGNHTIYAHWSAEQIVAGFCAVTFDAGNFAVVDPARIHARYDEPYGDLPVPVREGYTFLGWYTARTDGDRVTSVTTVPHMSATTLYARWDVAPASGLSLSDLSYQFPNSRDGFHYGDDYKIDYSQYALIFGDREAARWYYENDVGWGGNCYGMAVTSGMFYQKEKGVELRSFRQNAISPSQLAVSDKNTTSGWNGLSLSGFIEAMQVSQKSSQIQNELNKNREKLNELCEAVDSFYTSGSDPVVIAIARKKAGHAVLGYKLVEVSSTETRLMVYDSNFPNTERYITLTRSPSGQYISWYYHMNNQDSWGSNYEGSWISFVSYSYVRMPWVNRGKTKTDMERELLSVNTDSAMISDSANAPVATVMGGELHTERSDIFSMLEMADTASSTDKRFSVWLPVGEYTVTNRDPSVSEIEAAMVHWDQSAVVRTGASSVTYLVDDVKGADLILLDEPGKPYEITFSSTLSGAKKKVTLTGVTGDDISPENKMALAQIGGVLYADRVSLGSDGTDLMVDGKAGAASDIGGSAIDKIAALLSSQANAFEDVPSTAFCAEAVTWAVGRGITNGYTDTIFGPGETCTRAQILTFLWRAEGSMVVSIPDPFADVGDRYYKEAARWAYSKGLVDGLKFEGDTPCTRAEAVTYLWKLKDSPDAGSGPFVDVPVGAVYAKAVAWAVQQGITAGMTPTTFAPERICTRGHIVTFLYRHYT